MESIFSRIRQRKNARKSKTTSGSFAFPPGCISGRRRRRSPPHDNIFRSLSPPRRERWGRRRLQFGNPEVGLTLDPEGEERKKKIAFLSFACLGLSFGQKRSYPPEGGEKCVFPTSFFIPRPAPLKYFVACCKARLI